MDGLTVVKPEVVLAKIKSVKFMSVPPVARSVIDGWLTGEAGLPPRVVNACNRKDINTVGELRVVPSDTLMSIRSFGVRSMNDVKDFFSYCALLERGKLQFESVPKLLERFLSQTSLAMLIERYALRDPECSVKIGATLDAVGQQFGLTRERVRQQMISIIKDLKSQLARACLAPIVTGYEDFMRARDGVAGIEELQTVPFIRWLDGLNPCRVLQLLSEVYEGIVLQGSLFSLLPPEILQDIEKTAVRCLSRYPRPQHLSDVIAEFEEQGWFRKPRGYNPRLIVRIMQNSDLIGATQDDCYFLFPEGAVYLLATLVTEFPTPVRQNVIVDRFNEEVKAASRRNTAYITDLLTRSPVFIRGRDGTYRLRK